MNKVISIAALLIALTAVGMVVFERIEHRRELHDALAQRDAQLAQRYTRMISRLAHEMNASHGRDAATIEDALNDLRDAVNHLSLTQYNERHQFHSESAIPLPDGVDDETVMALADTALSSDETRGTAAIETSDDPPPVIINNNLTELNQTAGIPPRASSAGRIVLVEADKRDFQRELVLLSTTDEPRRQLTAHVPKTGETQYIPVESLPHSAEGDRPGFMAMEALAMSSKFADNRDPCWRDDHTIVFVSNRSGNDELWSLDLNTDVSTQLTDTPGAESLPAASLNGRLAWTYHDDSQDSIYIEGDGTLLTPKLLIKGGTRPSWSPDGTQLAFYAVPGGPSIIAASGGEPLALDLTFDAIFEPGHVSTYDHRWSPDGKSLLCTSIGKNIDTKESLISVTIVNLGNPRAVVVRSNADFQTAQWAIDWSPDGQRILFASFTREKWTLMTMLRNGDDAHTVKLAGPTQEPFFNILAAWEPMFAAPASTGDDPGGSVAAR